MKIPSELCIKCKAADYLCGWYHERNSCRIPYCPLLAKLDVPSSVQSIGEDFAGPSSSVFIGRVGYPDVFVGPLAADFVVQEPSELFGQDYGKIISMRSSVLRSKNRQNIFSRASVVEKMQEIALAKKPADIEMQFKKKPVYRPTFSSITAPMGPSAILKKLTLQSNISISRKVEYVINDDLLATEQAKMLYRIGQDIYKITTILSAGILGLEENKKMIPTRYSITAVDDILCKNMLDDVRHFPQINECRVYSSEYLGNHFEILLMPGPWEYEGFESWAPGSFWAANLKNVITVEEYEPFGGRKSYADKQGGGYYAARFGIVEALWSMRKQARAIVFREISEKYIIPLGVWVVRETVRHAMQQQPKKFAALDEALKYLDTRLHIKTAHYRAKSRMLQQSRLSDFL